MAMVGLASGAVQCGLPTPRPVSVKVMARTPDTQSGDFHTSLARRNCQIAQMAWKSCLSNYAQCPGMSLAAFMYHCTWSLEPHARARVYGSTCQLRCGGPAIIAQAQLCIYQRDLFAFMHTSPPSPPPPHKWQTFPSARLRLTPLFPYSLEPKISDSEPYSLSLLNLTLLVFFAGVTREDFGFFVRRAKWKRADCGFRGCRKERKGKEWDRDSRGGESLNYSEIGRNPLQLRRRAGGPHLAIVYDFQAVNLHKERNVMNSISPRPHCSSH